MDDEEVSLTSTQPSVHSDSSEFEIDVIVGKKNTKYGPKYLVRWLGYDDSRATWEPSDVFADQDALVEWERTNKALDAATRRERIEVVEDAIRAAEEKSRQRKKCRRQLRSPQSHAKVREHASVPREEEEEHDKQKSPEIEGGKTPADVSDSNSESVPNDLKRKRRGSSSPNDAESESPKPVHPKPKKLQRTLEASPTEEINSTPPDAAKETTSVPRIPKYLGAGKSTYFRNYMTQNRVRKIYGAEPAPDKSALSLREADRIDEEMEKAHAQRAADPLGYNATYETVGDRRRAREALKARSLSADDALGPDKVTGTALNPDLSMHTMPAPSINQSKPPSWERKDLLNGRFWYWGEILVKLSFDKISIGDSRFHGLDESSRRSLIHMKKDHLIQLNARDVWDKETYVKVCYGKSNTIMSKGCVIGFDDNKASVKEMANYLQYHNCIALVWHPNKECVFIFYSLHSPDWHFFENTPGKLSDDHDLRVICRSYFEDIPLPTFTDNAEPFNELTLNVPDGHKSPSNQQTLHEKPRPPKPQPSKTSRPAQDYPLHRNTIDAQEQENPMDQQRDEVHLNTQDEVKKSLVLPNTDPQYAALSSPPQFDATQQKTTDPRLRFREQKKGDISDENKKTSSEPTSNQRESSEAKPNEKRPVKPQENSESKQQEQLALKLGQKVTSTTDANSSPTPILQSTNAGLLQSRTDPMPQSVTTSSNSETLINHIYKTAIQWPGVQQLSIDCYIFYLLFPEQQKRQLDQIEEFIEKQPTTNFTFSETQLTNKTFSKFSTLLKGMGKSLGVILMHNTKRDFMALPQLTSLLKGTSQLPKAKAKSLPKLNVFAVSLDKPIFDLASAGHLQRLFPHFGVCILLTEGAMTKEPLNALLILKWFEVWRRKKPNWKICLRPRVRLWLNEMIYSDKHNSRGKIMAEMLNTINNIIPDSSINYGDVLLTPSVSDDGYESIGNDGDSDDEGNSDPLISVSRLKRYGQPPSNREVSQLTKDEHVLVEWFAGWAYKRVTKHRCFTAVTTESLKDWAAWNHIEIITPARFMEDMGILGDEGNA